MSGITSRYKYKIEFYLKDNIQKQIFITNDRFNLMDIISRQDVDLSRDIQVYEKKDNSPWDLVSKIENGKVMFSNYNVVRDIEQENAKQELERIQVFEDLPKVFDNDVCPSRRENQSLLEITFDKIFGKEDITKPKLQKLK